MEPTATPPPQATPPVAPPPALVRPVRPAEMDDPSKWPRFLPHVTVSWDPSPARFHYEKKLGRGAYGFTFRLRDVMNPHAAPIALKVMNLLKPGDKPPNRREESEADLQVTSKDRVQAELDHMGLVQNHFAFPKLLGWTYVDPTADHDQAHALVFMECCDGGDLQAAIHARAYHAKGSFPFLEIEVHLVFVHLLCALNHLHRQGATHRDIKSANILLVANSVLTDFQTTSGLYANYKPTGLDNIARVGCCKLTDFGFASIKRELKTKLGTWEYWAPELFNGTDTYTNKVDVWAAGVVLYEMIALQRPFPERNHMKRMQDAVTKGQFPPLEGLKWAGNFNRLHPELFSTVASMLTVDEAARPSVSELLDSNFGRTAMDNFCRWAVSNAQTQASSLFMALRQDKVTLPDWVMAQLTAIPPPSHRAAADEFDDLAPPEDDPDFDLGGTPESTDPASPRSAIHAEGVATTSVEQPDGDASPGGGSRLRRVLARARSSDQFESPFLPQAGASVLREPLTPLSTPLRNMPTMPAAALASAATPPRVSRPHPPRGYDARAYPRSAIVTNVAVALTSPTNSNPAKSTSRPASDRDSSPASADALRVDSADGPPSM